MTSEVGVMNRNGIALAADSAVTVGRAAGKIYTSADKLFQLAENSPVGIMVYGNVSFLRVPWETIIKTYRTQLRSRTFPRLTDYVANFIRFIKTQKRMFPAMDQKKFVDIIANNYFTHLHKNFIGILEREEKLKKTPSEAETKRIFTKLVRDELAKTDKAPKLHGLPGNIAYTIRKKYRKGISEAKRRIFEGFPISQLTDRRLTDLVSKILTCRRVEESGIQSGVVIAGFGEKEYYPALVEISMAGMVAGHPLYLKVDVIEIGKDMDACVYPFAQKEMVLTFMQGIDPDLRHMIELSTVALFEKVTEIILDQVKSKHPRYGKEIEGKVDPNLKKLLNDLLQHWQNIRNSEYQNPVMQMVASLPKDELGAMAESLVNLTKFKRRVIPEQETVAGPIDVAVISKGDGFVWINRKHYFKPELNPRYLAHVRKGDSQ